MLALLAPLRALPQAQPDSGLRGFVISPLMFRVSARPGERVELAMMLQNLEPKALRANITIQSVLWQDYTYSPLTESAHAKDASGWFQPVSNEPMEARAQRQVKFVFLVPRTARGAYWALATIRPEPVDSDTQMRVVFDVPIIILVGSQPRPDVRAQGPTLSFTSGQASMFVDLDNRGEGFSVLNATADVTNIDTRRVVGRYEITDRNLYPTSKRRVSFGVGQLPPGRYRLRYWIDLGTRRMPVMQSEYLVRKDEIEAAIGPGAVAIPPLYIEPSAIVFEIPPGGQKTQRVLLTNTSDRPLKLNLSVSGVSQSEKGSLSPEGPPPKGLRLTVSPRTIDLPPSQSRQAVVRVASDRNATGDSWFAVRMQGFDQADQAQVEDLVLCNAPIQGTLEPKLQIENLRLVKDGQRVVGIKFAAHNTGNQAVRPLRGARLLEGGVTPVASLEVPLVGDGGLLPGAVVEHEVVFPPGLPPGEYLCSVQFQYGPELFADGGIAVSIGKAPTKPAEAKPKPKPKPKPAPKSKAKKAKPKRKSSAHR